MKTIDTLKFALLAAFAPVSFACAQTNAPLTISVDVSQPGARVSPELYGIFFEEINHAGEGGLYAELVQNRDFEANTIPEGWRVEDRSVITPLGWRTRQWFTNDLPAWSFIAEGGSEGEIAQETESPLNDRNPKSMRLSVSKHQGRVGAANSGFWGMNIQAGEWYDLTFHARSETNHRFGLVVSLESEDGSKVCGRATIPEVGGPWRKYTLAIQARETDPKARLVIAMPETGTIWFDTVSLFPRKTFKNRPNGMRPDVAQMLVDMKPAFLRFPGGCVVEGVTLENRIRWKDSIGDISQRKGDFNLWGYYNTYGLGYHEFLQLAEDLEAETMYVVNAGMSCQARSPAEVAPEADLNEYVRETLDALEYALGPTNSTWGARRLANGREEPFRIKYVEIGNENWGSNYVRHYKVFYDAIKEKYPGITTIADEPSRRQPAFVPEPMEIRDDHFYVEPRRFFEMARFYDDADRNGPKIYVGEYAVNRGVGRGNLLGALSEAVFMLNMEKNSDIVIMTSYAPLFENVNQRNWPVNLILLDSSRTVGRSSYQVQKLFAAHRPDVVLHTEVQAPRVAVANTEVQQLYALAGLEESSREVILKVVNPTPTATVAMVRIQGAAGLGAQGKVVTLSHPDATAENSLEEPELIVPVASVLRVTGPEFSHVFAPNSLTILRLPTSGERR